ncbi:MAG: hypothetical protein L6R36_003237 [Xanthoria steineri]|nr:MAG: hypothetical protein L6R36_003237 [Xanthoria steineri]
MIKFAPYGELREFEGNLYRVYATEHATYTFCSVTPEDPRLEARDCIQHKPHETQWTCIKTNEQALRCLAAILRKKRDLSLQERGFTQSTTPEGAKDTMEKVWQEYMAGLINKTNNWLMEIRIVNRSMERAEWRILE